MVSVPDTGRVLISFENISGQNGVICTKVSLENTTFYNVQVEVWMRVQGTGVNYFSLETKPQTVFLNPMKNKTVNLCLSDGRIYRGQEYTVTVYAAVGNNVTKISETYKIPVKHCDRNKMLDGKVVKKDVTEIVKKYDPHIKKAVLTYRWSGGIFMGFAPSYRGEEALYNMWKKGWTVAAKYCPEDHLSYYFQLPAHLELYYSDSTDQIREKKYEKPKPQPKAEPEEKTSDTAHNTFQFDKRYLALPIGIGLGLLAVYFATRR